MKAKGFSFHESLIQHKAVNSMRDFLRLLGSTPFGIISSHFRPRRHLLTAERYREEMELRFETWSEVSCVRMAA